MHNRLLEVSFPRILPIINLPQFTYISIYKSTSIMRHFVPIIAYLSKEIVVFFLHLKYDKFSQLQGLATDVFPIIDLLFAKL